MYDERFSLEMISIQNLILHYFESVFDRKSSNKAQENCIVVD